MSPFWNKIFPLREARSFQNVPLTRQATSCLQKLPHFARWRQNRLSAPSYFNKLHSICFLKNLLTDLIRILEFYFTHK